MKTIIFPLLILPVMAGCGGGSGSQEAADTSAVSPAPIQALADNSANSRNSVDWAGTYKGTVPCADCQGIETTLVLNDDLSYELTEVYLGKDGKEFLQTGKFEWNAAGGIISLTGVAEGPNQYLVGENMVAKLDMDGNRITGDLAQNYQLAKQSADAGSSTVGIEGKRWKLIELMGNPVEVQPSFKQDPFVMFNAANKRVNAYAGCNNIMGSYSLKEGNRITFSQMASTQMACQEMDLEKQLMDVLERADNYTMGDSTLSLNRAKMAPLARFVAVD